MALTSAAVPPSPSANSARCKRKEAHTEDTRELNSTLPISSSGFDGFRSPTGSHSEATELQPPSITSIPLGLGNPRQWRSTSKESWCSLASLYTSLDFNLPGHPVAGPGNLTPSIPSLAGSHHMSSTWPTSMFTSGPSSPHLTINQANSLYKLVAECQALSIKLAKKFQVLLGLEAIRALVGNEGIRFDACLGLMLRVLNLLPWILLDTRFDAWCCDKIANNVVGWVTRDTMICDLPEHGKMQPNHPNPVGLPLDYMAECRVFDSIQSDLYDLCRFYALGTTGNPPEFPTLREPVTCSQVRDLLKSAQSIGHPYMILVLSVNSVMAMSMLQELHTAACLRHLQVDLWDKSVKLILPLLCIHGGGGGVDWNDLS